MRQFESVWGDKRIEMREFANRLLTLYPLYRNIRVQRSKYSICIILFLTNGLYQILIKRDIYHGFGQEVDFNDLTNLINEYHG